MKRWVLVTGAAAVLMGFIIWRLDDLRDWVRSTRGDREGIAAVVPALHTTTPNGQGGASPAAPAVTSVPAKETAGAARKSETGVVAAVARSVNSTQSGSNTVDDSQASAPVAALVAIPPGQAEYPPVQSQSPARPSWAPSLPRQEPARGPSATYLKKLAEIAALGGRLPQRQIDGLYAYLNTRFADQSGMNLAEFNAVKNNILDTLLSQASVPQELGARMAAWSRDRTQDDLFRAYCVQHFVFYWEHRWRLPGTAAHDPEAATMLRAYWAAAQETQNSLSGTALAGLARISERDSTVDRSQVASKVLATALDPNVDECSRIAAVQLCGEMGLSGVVPEARRLAEDAGSIPLRLAAIAALGQTGGVAEQSFLNGLAASPRHGVLGRAVEAALLRLRDGRASAVQVSQ